METFFASLALCTGNSPVTGEFPAQRPVTRGFDVLFDLRLNKRLNKQWWGWWFEISSRSLWRHCNVAKSLPEEWFRFSGRFVLGFALLLTLLSRNWGHSTVTNGKILSPNGFRSLCHYVYASVLNPPWHTGFDFINWVCSPSALKRFDHRHMG